MVFKNGCPKSLKNSSQNSELLHVSRGCGFCLHTTAASYAPLAQASRQLHGDSASEFTYTKLPWALHLFKTMYDRDKDFLKSESMEN